MLLMPRLFLILSALAPAAVGTARGQGVPQLPEGTYALRFCFPTCDDSTSVIGEGTFVFVHGDIRKLMTRRDANSLSGELNFLLLGDESPPNACFQVTAQRRVAGREYYVGITRASLTIVTALPHDSVSVGLYASPDAFFAAILTADSSGTMNGVGRQ